MITALLVGQALGLTPAQRAFGIVRLEPVSFKRPEGFLYKEVNGYLSRDGRWCVAISGNLPWFVPVGHDGHAREERPVSQFSRSTGVIEIGTQDQWGHVSEAFMKYVGIKDAGIFDALDEDRWISAGSGTTEPKRAGAITLVDRRNHLPRQNATVMTAPPHPGGIIHAEVRFRSAHLINLFRLLTIGGKTDRGELTFQGVDFRKPNVKPVERTLARTPYPPRGFRWSFGYEPTNLRFLFVRRSKPGQPLLGWQEYDARTKKWNAAIDPGRSMSLGYLGERLVGMVGSLTQPQKPNLWGYDRTRKRWLSLGPYELLMQNHEGSIALLKDRRTGVYLRATLRE